MRQYLKVICKIWFSPREALGEYLQKKPIILSIIILTVAAFTSEVLYIIEPMTSFFTKDVLSKYSILKSNNFFSYLVIIISGLLLYSLIIVILNWYYNATNDKKVPIVNVVHGFALSRIPLFFTSYLTIIANNLPDNIIGDPGTAIVLMSFQVIHIVMNIWGFILMLSILSELFEVNKSNVLGGLILSYFGSMVITGLILAFIGVIL